jgi:DNA polymerase-3 subunit gamma/tau
MMQSVHVVGVEGRLLQLGFSSSGLRDNFHGSNREDTLREALREVTGVDWKIDALVDPSAGIAASGPVPVASVPAPVSAAVPVSVPAAGGSAAGGTAAQSGGPAASSPAPGANPDPGVATGATAASAPGFAAPASYGSPPPFAQSATPPEEDEPDPDDEDVADAGPTARDLLVRELGATVLEEGSDGD